MRLRASRRAPTHGFATSQVSSNHTLASLKQRSAPQIHLCAMLTGRHPRSVPIVDFKHPHTMTSRRIANFATPVLRASGSTPQPPPRHVRPTRPRVHLSRRAALALLASGTVATSSQAATATADRLRLSDEEWYSRLSPNAYAVLRQSGTERPFSSALLDEKRTGDFTCNGCGAHLFASSTKYDSGTGWPSFTAPLPGAVEFKASLKDRVFMQRQVLCKRCQGHLGHVFPAPTPTGDRFCINGVALDFVPN